MNLAAIDIGGSSIKFATWEDGRLQKVHALPTPDNLADFYQLLDGEVAKIKAESQVSGVAISSPGAVNKRSGVIEGASALPYIHNFPIVPKLEELFGLPVSIENDANCAALAELAAGAGKNNSSLAFLVIGTGVGGAIIFNRQIWHGAHLYGGEFGYQTTAQAGMTLSQAASPVQMAERYSRESGHEASGKEVYDLAKKGDQLALKEKNRSIKALAEAIYNLQHGFDPEKIIIGGAISNNPDLLTLLNEEISRIRQEVGIATVKPELAVCEYRGEANLRGCVYDFEQEHGEK
ncbi:ROK family protein [Lactobacillus porci]|uniref:ROK family protein n=1 Tax=Lactobacillus porci TaxID=2012477 RepID=UPI00399346B5